ncbi:MAG: class I SAM-dependent methyltransferase [Desulfuromonadales bacterium]|nr:class I SAM-dependent methyltransferase [Desulfuromonadales bacterium]NIS43854.1 class I SAM-dependent methyltransferase [Desulfuromonadales bacterium]
MGFLSWAMARYYDAIMANAERSCLGQWRSELLAGLSGRVLEIGAGTGVNLRYYPAAVSELVLTEPDRHMRSRLDAKLADLSIPHHLIGTTAESLPFANESFDAAVVTLVLCSVHDQQQSLAELNRVLKPGSAIALIEHVAAAGPGRTLRLQQRLEPLWKRCAGNCHLTRDTLAAFRTGGFNTSAIARDTMLGAPKFAAPVIRGIAEKPEILAD